MTKEMTHQSLDDILTARVNKAEADIERLEDLMLVTQHKINMARLDLKIAQLAQTQHRTSMVK